MTYDIAKELIKISGANSPQDAFSDWVQIMAISIASVCNKQDDALIEQYKGLNEKWREKLGAMADMMGMLVLELEEDMRDVLGEVFMRLNAGSKHTGQFFTPFHISYLIAKMQTFPDEPFAINEPSSGGGGLIIASAKVMHERGQAFQRLMTVTAQDLDYRSVYMTYVQLSLLGIKAKVIQGNTLLNEQNRVFYTPAYMGLML